MNLTELDDLIKETDYPCISLVLPCNNDKTQNEINFRNTLIEAAEILERTEIPEKQIKRILDQVSDQYPAELPAWTKGIGIFLSPTKSAFASFPFPVTKKISVDQHFETRDLWYLKQYHVPYYVLNLQPKTIRLFKGMIDRLEEVTDVHFPVEVKDDYEFIPPTSSSQTSSLQTFDEDKSIVKDIGLEQTYQVVRKSLKNYLPDHNTILILAGDATIVEDFIGTGKVSRNLGGIITDSFRDQDKEKLTIECWLTIVNHIQVETSKTIKRIQDDPRRAVHGVQDVWKAAHEGKGLLLLVEKDYHCVGYQKDSKDILLNRPLTSYMVVPDAVDELIETVTRMHGKVIFAENNQLKNLEHLALLLRFGSIHSEN